jgi:predicted O-methyltransferase YrrM
VVSQAASRDNLRSVTHELFTAVDTYLTEKLVPSDPILDAALAASDAAGLPQINVAPKEGAFLHLLAKLVSAKRILEIGTLGGYSTIWLARALPVGGSLISLEFEEKHAKVARANLKNAGFEGVAEVIVGPAIEALPTLVGPFDLVFIDADKRSTPGYFEWALKLTRPGSLIVVDNVVRGGKVVDQDLEDPDVNGIQTFLEMAGQEPRVTVTALQTVGSKGYDGMALALVN